MTPEQGYDLAKFQRPGVKIVMGATGAREEKMAPVNYQVLRKLPGDWSWVEYDLRKRLGFLPSLWARMYGLAAEQLGHMTTDAEWKWLSGPSSSLQTADAWLDAIREKAKK